MSTALPLGSLALFFLVDRIGRIKIAGGAFMLAAVFAILFRSSSSDQMLLMTGFVMAFFVALTTGTTAILSAESFPRMRGRSGAVLALVRDVWVRR
jgi:MFS family permease